MFLTDVRMKHFRRHRSRQLPAAAHDNIRPLNGDASGTHHYDAKVVEWTLRAWQINFLEKGLSTKKIHLWT